MIYSSGCFYEYFMTRQLTSVLGCLDRYELIVTEDKSMHLAAWLVLTWSIVLTITVHCTCGASRSWWRFRFMPKASSPDFWGSCELVHLFLYFTFASIIYAYIYSRLIIHSSLRFEKQTIFCVVGINMSQGLSKTVDEGLLILLSVDGLLSSRFLDLACVLEKSPFWRSTT